jgi:hypothetical protein
MKKKYAKAQIDYLAAKEHFLQASKQADLRIEENKQQGTEVDEPVMLEVVEKSGLHRSYNELVQAENTLLKWSQTVIKNLPEVERNRVEYEAIYEKVNTDKQARAVMIDLAMRLNAEAE